MGQARASRGCIGMKIQTTVIALAALLVASATLAVLFYSQDVSRTATQASSQTSLPSPSGISAVDMRPPSRMLGNLKSLEEIQNAVDFKIKVPSNLPESVRFQGAFLSTPREVVQGRSGQYTVTAITLVYWDKDVTAQTTHRNVLQGGGFFVKEIYVPGATLEDFKRPCCPVRVENGKAMEEERYYPISELWGHPAIITAISVEAFDMENAVVYEVISESLSKEKLLSVMESLIRG